MNNRLIRASAGTGKTFALATRMIRLMLLGVEPNHIVALTFSRAAAGEIFNRLAGRLANAASSESGAAKESAFLFDGPEAELARALRERAGEPVPRADFAALLRRLIATQHASMIGTIDSFMTRMVQAFPLELGLQGPLSIMDDYRVAREKADAMSALLNRVAADPAGELFSESFRLATFGREGKTYGEKLAAFMDDWHGILLDHPEPSAWGRPDIIWPRGLPFPVHADLAALADQLDAEIRADWAAVDREKPWEEFCAFVRAFNGTFSDKAGIQNVLSAYQPNASSITIRYNRQAITFAGSKARLILDAVETLYGLVLRARCQSTQGLYALMAQLEAAYARNTRACGLLTFDDIPRLIAGLAADVRQNIEYRFDCRFSHWALDEFQDTSRAQWNAVRNLVDEIIQSDDDARSLFVVGDMKQAIYGWRGGDVGIFEREADSGHYALADLNASYRYCPQIAELVNRVFDGARLAARLADGAPGAGRRWQKLWSPHASRQRDGFASVERVPAPERESDEKPLDPYLRAACRHFLELRPWERGVSAAVLVRTNDQGQRFADALRRAGVPAVWEGESAICDTPVVTAFLHLLKIAEHPGDTLAWRHVCASPLADTVFRDICALPQTQAVAQLSRRVLEDVSRLGLPRALRNYIVPLADAEPFTRTRLDDLLRAATQFAAEADAETTLTDFADYVASFKTRDVADTSTVKILTVHRSKGLGFDLVLLPIIENTGLDVVPTDGVLFAPDDAWLLTNPGRQVVAADATLSAARAHTVDDGVFEELCVHYVAMTRAKRELIVLLRPESKAKSETRYFADHIADAFGGTLPWSTGDRRWIETAAEGTQTALSSAHPPIPLARPARRVMRRVTPSSFVCYGRAASELFSPRDDAARQRGTRLHEALSRIEWLDPAAPQPPDLPIGELDLTVPSAFRDALARPPDAVELWRERDFELIVGDDWISGTFDRVVFHDGPAGRSADIYDFKTNRRRSNESEAAFALRLRDTYEGQMDGYRRALARLADMPERSIRCILLATATRQALTNSDHGQPAR